MAITTLYTCDKCGTVQPTPEQFWSVGIVVVPGGGPILGYQASKKHMEVCCPCLELLGFYRESGPTAPALPDPPTLEDLIREIARAEITDLTGAA